MRMNVIEEIKSSIFSIVSKIDDLNKLLFLRNSARMVEASPYSNKDNLSDISFYIGNIESTVNIEKIRQAQKVQPLLISDLDILIEEANFEEDIDELLSSLN
jgi:hypothetical protein